MKVHELEFYSENEPTRVIKLGHDKYSDEEVIELFGDILIKAREDNAYRMGVLPEEYEWWEFKFAADYLVKHLGFVLVEKSE